MRKYKIFVFIASLILVAGIMAGCTSDNPIAEDLAGQRAALSIGSFENGSISVNGTEINPGEAEAWEELFEVGSEVNLKAEPDEGYTIIWEGVEFDEEPEDITDIDLVITEENMTVIPEFVLSETDGTGAAGLAMEMETEPGDTIVGENIEGPPAVIITNNDGPVVDVEVTVSIESDFGLDGAIVQTTDENGIATFNDLVIDQVGEGYELVFDAEFADLPLRVISEQFDIFEEVDNEVYSIEINPDEDQVIKAGETIEFSAAAYNESGDLLEDVIEFNWENTGENGLFDKTEAGDYEVSASYAGVTSPATKVTVNHAEVVENGDHKVTIEPAGEITVQAGEDKEFTAKAEDEYGNLITDDVAEFNWSSTDDNGVFNETTVEDYTVSAEYAGVESPETAVKVIAPIEGVKTVVVEPEEDQTVKAGEEIQFSAIAYDEFGNEITSDASLFEWENTDKNGLFMETDASDYQVKASLNGIESNTVNVKVTAIPAEPGEDFTINIDPSSTATVEAGDDLNFTVEARDEYDNLITNDVNDFNWTGATAGLFNETVAKDYDVYASLEGKDSETTVVTVTAQSPDNPDEVNISPAPTASVQAGVDLEFEADAKDQYGNVIADDVTEFIWTGAENGVFNATTVDDYTVSAEYAGVSSAETVVTVTPFVDGPVEVVIAHDGDDNTIIAGESLQFNATASDEFGNVITDEANDFTWTNTDGSGLFTETIADNYTVTASYDGTFSNEIRITVNARPADPEEKDHTVTISPEQTANVQSGVDLEFSASAEDRYGNLITDDVAEFNWSGTDANGVFNETTVEDYRVSAEYKGVESPETAVTLNIFTDAIINPTTGKFNLDAPTNITTVINWNDAEAINAITLGEETLDTGDYDILNIEDAVILVIYSEFFEDRELTVGEELDFAIEFNAGKNATLTVEIIDEETDYDNGYLIDPDEVYEDGDFVQEFIITLDDDEFKAGAIVEAHLTLGGDFADLEIVDIEKGDFPSRTDKLMVKLAGELVKDTGKGYIGVSSARMVSGVPFIAWVDVFESISGELVDFDSISFTTQKVNSSSGNVNVDEDSEINTQTVEEGHVALELLNGTITGAKDPNKSLLNGEYDLLILVRDYEGDNDENGYPFTAEFEDGMATGIDIPDWEFNVDAGSISISLPSDLYLKFR